MDVGDSDAEHDRFLDESYVDMGHLGAHSRPSRHS